MAKAVILLANGFEEVEAITPADYLNRAGIEVVLAGIGGKTIKGSHGISVQVDCDISSVQDNFDCVIIPGGMPGSTNIAQSDAAIKLIRGMNAKGKVVAAICAAPAIVLMKAGIIKGKRVTCFPGIEGKLDGAVWSEARVVTDGNIITSRSAGTAAEFSLAIIEQLAGKAASDKVAQAVLLQ